MSTENVPLAFGASFLSRNPPTDARIARMAEWGKKLVAAGLAPGMAGNLSFRTRLGFIITGAGVALDAITPESVSEITGVVYGLNRTSVYVKGPVLPSHETVLHAQVYEERDDVNAIFHAHDDTITKSAEKAGVPVTVKEQPAGSLELAREAISLIKANGGVKYLVLRNHGVVALGGTLDEAGALILEMRKKAGR